MGVPKLALAPLLILWFGIGVVSKIVFVAAVVFFFLFFNTLAGMRSIDPRLRLGGARRSVRASGRSPGDRLAHRAALRLRGAQVALPRAIGAAVVGEFIAADRGLGYYINNARSMADPVGLFTGVTLVTLLVLVIDAVSNACRRAHWPGVPSPRRQRLSLPKNLKSSCRLLGEITVSANPESP